MQGSCPDAATPVWGLTLTEIHDRYWASRGFQIIRPGGPKPDPDGPELYVLLDEDKLVGFGVRRLLRIMSWMHPRAIRVRLVETESSPYHESVRDDSSGKFIKFVRSYNARQIHSAQLWITPSISYAKIWNESVRTPASSDRSGSAPGTSSNRAKPSSGPPSSRTCPIRKWSAARSTGTPSRTRPGG